MKNQYFGDIGDYKKYSFLRSFAAHGQSRILVCWMLTENDMRTDGRHIQYLSQPQKWRQYDSHVFDLLERLVIQVGQRDVTGVEQHDLIPGSVFFSDVLADNRTSRQRYFAKVSQLTGTVDLVFFDPDNGMEVKSTPYGTRNSSKYLYWDELISTYAAGVSVLVYQHYQRVKREVFVSNLATEFLQRTGASEVHALRPRSTGSMYFLIPQSKHRTVIASWLTTLAHQWGEQLLLSTHTQSIPSDI